MGAVMTNYKTGHDFETAVHGQLSKLEQLGFLRIEGRNVKVEDKDGNQREIDILIYLIGPVYEVEVCVECKKRDRVKVEAIDKIRSLRSTLRYNNFLIVSNGAVSKPTAIAAKGENVPIILYEDLEELVTAVFAHKRDREQLVAMSAFVRMFPSTTPEEKILWAVKDYIPAEWSLKTRYWPLYVTSQTTIGRIFLRWICIDGNIDWPEVESRLPEPPNKAFASGLAPPLRGSSLLKGDR